MLTMQFQAHVGKSETASNLRTNNHRSASKKQESIAVDQHFATNGHNFTKHARVTLIEKVKEEITMTLERREDFCMQKLNTITPDGFNQELNFPR